MRIDIIPLMLMSLVVAAVTVAVLWIWPDSTVALGAAGEGGKRRKEALASNEWFKFFEPLIVALAQKVAVVPLGGCRERIEANMRKAGRPLGLSVEEFLAGVILCMAAAAISGFFLARLVDRSIGAWVVVGAVFGLMAPFQRIQTVIRQRQLAISRGLPQTIDLVALAMEAGLDFHGAMTQVVSRMSPADPLRFELEHILEKLVVGKSRRAALQELAVRVPITPVRQFVSSVVQAEQRGTPLAQVLSIQAEIMRTRRSEAVEQAASRAAILIFGPLMLIFASIFVILLGPFVIKLIRGELF